MKSKVMLFDAEGAQVGETFMRRAKQLVSQQRAEWINDGAIRFAADADIEFDEIERPKDMGQEALLYYLAEQRIFRRKLLILHSVLFLPGLILVAIFADMARDDVLRGFMVGSWVAPFMLHVAVYFRSWLVEYKPRHLEAEVAKLRRQMK